MDQNILDEPELELSNSRRRNLLPIWIKVFIWIFLLFGLIAPIALILGIIGMNFNLALYGLETIQPLSLIGIIIIFLFALKGITAFGLWTEKDWAVNFAILDAIVGIVVCIFIMFVLPFINNGVSIVLRLELVLLIPYLIKMRKIKSQWMNTIEMRK